MNLWGAVAIGIGGMVGGGIFAVLGLAVNFAQGATPVAFFIAGVIALITGYSYSKLSVHIPSRGGTVTFIDQTFGTCLFSGGMNNLLWISYIVMLSLYASAFGSYAAGLALNNPVMDPVVLKHVFITAVLILSAVLNFASARLIGTVETVVVVIKLSMLAFFIVLGLVFLPANANSAQLAPGNWESIIKIIAGGMIIFLAYEGFELIANTALDISDPSRNLPRAYFISIIVVIVLYILVAIVTVGSLPFQQIAEAQDYALAAAAKPFMGELGYTLIAITALLSTFSAINATYYGGSRVSVTISEDDELPYALTRKVFGQPIGLIITTVLALLSANLMDLESISTSGSAGFLLIFAVVNAANYRQAKNIKSNRFIAMLGVILCLAAVFVLMIQQFTTNLVGALVVLGMVIGSFLIELIYKRKEYGHAHE